MQGYRGVLSDDVEVSACTRFDFYDLARQPDVAAVVATADMRPYANLMLTIGVRSAA